ncbi:MAG TPA: response regulator transcription factor [Anaerolineae bacterium]|nr:response regulator transcription factor [Anaerolineae bacterium]
MCVLLADDQAEVRSALRLLLEQEANLTVAGEAGNAGELLARALDASPDIVMLDWELPGLQPTSRMPAAIPQFGVIAALRVACPRIKVIVLSGRPEARQQALDAGADAFASKGDPPEKLLETIRAVGE